MNENKKHYKTFNSLIERINQLDIFCETALGIVKTKEQFIEFKSEMQLQVGMIRSTLHNIEDESLKKIRDNLKGAN